jgi:Outer membrane protein beta-barrel family/CarboxypepD_reg-like domain
MIKRLLIILLPVIFFTTGIKAQNIVVTGTLLDNTDHSPLIGAGVALIDTKDSSLQYHVVTNTNGQFAFHAHSLIAGNYTLQAMYLGYNTFQKNIYIQNTTNNLGTLYLTQAGKRLKEVKVVGQVPPAQLKGDTLDFNAKAFKAQPDATAEDLVGKMPGIMVNSNGSVTAQGETVQQVLVDGKPFFGNDPTTALRNLPAEVIDKIEVFDKMSDQAQFTGFDDGNSQKTINIVTRVEDRNGQFGKLYAGYGTNGRYSLGGNINFFNNDRRISVIGIYNNINQQNFATQDLLGVMSSGGKGGGGRGGYGGGYGGGAAGNFLVNQQNGIATTSSIGLNYSDNWGKKITVTGSYFFNHSDNITNEVLTQNYFLAGDSSQVYNEHDLGNANNYNQRINLRLEYQIDSKNSIILTPRLNFQNYTSNSSTFGQYTLPDSSLISQTNNQNYSHTSGYDIANDLLFRHAFAKRGRTFSVDVSTDLNKKDGNTELSALNDYFKDPTASDDTLNQQSLLNSHGQTISGNFVYTEPIGRKAQLMVEYNTSYTNGLSDQNTYQFNYLDSKYNDFDTSLSNDYTSKYITNRGGASFRYRSNKGLFFVAGLDYQAAQLTGYESFPSAFTLTKNFDNVLANAMMRYQISRAKNLRFFYRMNTSAPSLSQLQDVINNTNPLQLSTGNPALAQQTTQSLITRYSSIDAAKSKMFFAFFAVQNTHNYISNNTITATKDSVLNGGILLNKGSQLTLPVNLNGYWNIRSFATLGLPLKPIKSNLNLNGGINYTRTPGMVNNEVNISNNYGLSVPVVISSNISEDLDFTLSYIPNYNIVKNSIQPSLNSNYFSNSAQIKINWIFWKGFEINNDVTYTKNSGLGTADDKPYVLWNASIGKRFFKKQNGEIQLSVFDLLKENQSISRDVTETYIQTSNTQVLQQYFMLTFTYNLKNFKGQLPTSPYERFHHMFPGGAPFGRPGGGPPPGGMH